jgi:hypothetical protein
MKADAPAPARAAFNVDFGLIEKFHFSILNKKCTPAKAEVHFIRYLQFDETPLTSRS